MIHFTCTYCPANLSAEDSQRFIKCGWCRNQVTVPRLTKLELDSFTRANRQRQNKQFAEAEKNYQLVLNAHPQDHEALWGLVLCHYGIVYVEDKGDVLPTCWICRPQPILEHPDYQYACELVEEKRHALEAGGVRDEAVEQQIAAYGALLAQRKRDGQYICKAQQDIRHLSETMQPYDIFLCYKHSVIGNPDALTEDSQLANDLCLMLSKEGYRVFYAPVDTKGRAGENYESLIYHALKTAKVMLTISTHPDHLKCSWPQSEWSRFIYMMNQGEDKHLIPLYKHMRVSALPDAFLNRGWTAFDMGDQFYGKYLLDNLEQYIPKSKPSDTPKKRPIRLGIIARSVVLTLLVCLCGVGLLYLSSPAGQIALGLQTALPVAESLASTATLAPQTPETDFEYTIQDDGTCSIDKYIGSDSVVWIPSAINEHPVVTISEEAFRDCSFLTSVFIPDSVTSICYAAFDSCSNLASISIPSSVTSIHTAAFQDCTSLTSIAIPDNVTRISSLAFSGCISLTNISIPNSVTSIDSNAFADCTGLISISIPESVTFIDRYAFEECTSLTSISIPSSVTRIGFQAFQGCTSLTSISIPNSVVNIDGGVFSGCTSLTSIVIPNGITEIEDYTFYGCTSLTSIFIPNSVREIGDHAFAGCTSLTNVSIPDSVSFINFSAAFKDCTSLTSISIPDSIESLYMETFAGCTNLTSIFLPRSMFFIDYTTFSNCPNLTIHAPRNSIAIDYARANDIPYAYTD